MPRPEGMTQRDFFFYQWLVEVKKIETEEQLKEVSDSETWAALNKEWEEALKSAHIFDV